MVEAVLWYGIYIYLKVEGPINKQLLKNVCTCVYENVNATLLSNHLN